MNPSRAHSVTLPTCLASPWPRAASPPPNGRASLSLFQKLLLLSSPTSSDPCSQDSNKNRLAQATPTQSVHRWYVKTRNTSTDSIQRCNRLDTTILFASPESPEFSKLRYASLNKLTFLCFTSVQIEYCVSNEVLCCLSLAIQIYN